MLCQRTMRVVLTRAVLGLSLLSPLSVWAEPYDSGSPAATQRLLIHAAQQTRTGHYSAALAILGRAAAISPNDGDVYDMRAATLIDVGRFEDARADMARLKAIRPGFMSIAMYEARIDLYQGRPEQAVETVNAALKMPLLSAKHGNGGGQGFIVTGHIETMADMYLSIALQMQHQDDASLGYFDRMLTIEAQFPEHVLTQYCWVAATAGLADSAEAACERAVTERDHDIGQYEGLGYAHLREGKWSKAVEAYNTALDRRPGVSLSLYGRGIARRMSGDTAGGNADIAAAKAQEPDIVNIMARLGVKPA